MENFKTYFNSMLKEDESQYLAQLNIDNDEDIYKVASKAKTPEDLKVKMIAIKTKFPDAKKINFDKVNWKEVYSVLNEAELSDLQVAYRKFFEDKLKKFDVGSPADMEEDKMKDFFNEISSEWPAAKKKLNIG